MCFGGGGSAATIVQPDYNAYNQEFELQKAAIERTMDSGLQMQQQELTSALRSKQSMLDQVSQQARIQAENTNAQALRLSQLIGPPPPEESAQAPKVGSEARDLRTKKGKSALRIARGFNPTQQGSGSGLNITTTPV